ncbi:hypothetical protein J4573_31875 [Actinomadura barringtoniae]|uniref:Uncharacterized protein n=1 Tax=Actinomadura barringtoniae TaxID=1427535 RepID=A0A939PNB2_9ACTN|nr:hypothetical protein [Actinomadura barringtoniae]MBO2451726.1 hypothetical protein [Actinomadura barringtoniae]
MEPEPPLVRELFPDLVAELVTLLEEEGEPGLAIAAHDLRLVAECGCGDDVCQSFYSAPRPPGQKYGPGHRTIALSPSTGMLLLDVVNERIVYVEVLNRPKPESP